MRSYRGASLLVACLAALWAVVPAAAQEAVLPEYRPATPLSGVIRSWGNPHMAALMKSWEAGFQRFHPAVHFEDSLRSTATGIFGLTEWTADLALMGRQIYTYEYYGVYRRSLLLPVEIAVATGSLDRPGKSAALGVFVHAENPLRQLTLEQLDGVFGAQRDGGWDGLNWRRESARGPEGNIRTWGQLGLKGKWANKPIHLYGPPGIYPGGQSFFQRRVMGGADTWAEGLKEYEDRAAMMEALSRDPRGIAYAGVGHALPRTHLLALAEQAAGPFVLPTRATVADRSYPLSRTVYIYFAPDTPAGDPAPAGDDIVVREFLRYVLSRQGQQDVAREGDYLPLTTELARAQRAKLQ
jgi:phosphate transport system substrate-binding protein